MKNVNQGNCLINPQLKTSKLDFGKMTVFFKTLSFGNGLSYQALLGLEWKIFCHSLWICFNCFIGYESLAAIIMVRCPYIYFQDSIVCRVTCSSSRIIACHINHTCHINQTQIRSLLCTLYSGSPTIAFRIRKA